MWLNQSQAMSIDTPSSEKGVSASESFNRGHLDKSPQGVWKGCKYKWQLPPPSRASLAKHASLLLFSSLQREKKSCSEQEHRLLGRKVLFILFFLLVCVCVEGDHTELNVSLDLGFSKSWLFFRQITGYQVRHMCLSRVKDVSSDDH